MPLYSLELSVPVTGVADKTVVGLEDTLGLTVLGLAVLEPEGVSPRDVERWSGHYLLHDRRTRCELVNLSLNQRFLRGGPTKLGSALGARQLLAPLTFPQERS